MIRHPRPGRPLLLAPLLLGCTLGPPAPEARPALTSMAGEPLDGLGLVPRLALSGLSSVELDALWLVRGRISEKELSQILASAPDEALAARRIPLGTWVTEFGVALAPLVVLEPSQEYTLLGLALGEISRLATAPTSAPIWWRWGAGAALPGGWVVYCAAEPPWALERSTASPAEGDVPLTLSVEALEPSGHEVDVVAGFSAASAISEGGDGEVPSCVRFRAPFDTGTVLPPHQVAGRFFDPSPLLVTGDSDPSDATGELEAAVRVVGSAVFLDLPPGLAEIALIEEAQPRVLRAELATRGSLPLGQFPLGVHTLSLTALSARGEMEVRTFTFEVQVERGFPVLSEVLANPLGPEPESEWLEIVNVGRAPLVLGGYVLEDSKGATVLPNVTLPAGAVGLVVRTDFVVGASEEAVPASAAIPVPVDAIGEDGLSNSGEALRLRDQTGTIVSEIPAASASAGQSIARRHLLAPDWAASFGPHAPPGSSPGLANELEESAP